MVLEVKKKKQPKLTINEVKKVIYDDQFLLKVKNLVETNFANEHFTVPFLAEALFTTRPTLYRYIKKTTSRSAITFIKLIRLMEAERLLKETDMPINHVAYQVGFKAPTHFSSCYKKEFGVTPKLVRRAA